MPPDSTILTKRLRLRPLMLADAAAIVSSLDDFEVARWLARVPFPYRLEDANRFVNWERAERHTNTERVFVIERSPVAAGEGMIGMISLRDYGRSPILGYWLQRSLWGHGYMTEAVGGLIDETFADPAVLEIKSGVFEGNQRSLAIQIRFGFKVIGRSSQHNLALQRDLAHIDTVLTRTRHEELRQ